ncbi:MAG TPA: SDR family NAD(P)-dependent oxidoreductase [Candidatus Angelobacter sp.]|nr:SDR family NAD(P)-dependent oxidoreductase [Candidatus Angelobacter sp.]
MNNDICGRNALVTGGTDGIGKEVARGLANRGIRVFIAGRDAAKGARAERELRDSTGNMTVEFIAADLGLASEVDSLAGKIAALCPALDYLVHSAGVVLGRRELNRDGIESNFAINYLARFALTQRLLPLLETAGVQGGASRIVLISGAAQNGKIYFDDVNLTANFSTVRAVGQFCQANDVFTVDLARQLQSASNPPRVTITCLKMGVVKTNIRREFPFWMKLLVPLLFDPLLGQTPREAACAALKLLLDQDFEGVTGALFLKIRKFKPLVPSAQVLEPKTGAQLRKLSELMTADHMSEVSTKQN